MWFIEQITSNPQICTVRTHSFKTPFTGTISVHLPRKRELEILFQKNSKFYPSWAPQNPSKSKDLPWPPPSWPRPKSSRPRPPNAAARGPPRRSSLLRNGSWSRRWWSAGPRPRPSLHSLPLSALWERCPKRYRAWSHGPTGKSGNWDDWIKIFLSLFFMGKLGVGSIEMTCFYVYGAGMKWQCKNHQTVLLRF